MTDATNSAKWWLEPSSKGDTDNLNHQNGSAEVQDLAGTVLLDIWLCSIPQVHVARLRSGTKDYMPWSQETFDAAVQENIEEFEMEVSSHSQHVDRHDAVLRLSHAVACVRPGDGLIRCEI